MTVMRESSGEWRDETFIKPVYPTAGVLYELTDMPDAKVGDRLILAISDGSEITAVAVEIETHVEQDGSGHQMVSFQFDPPLEPEPSRAFAAAGCDDEEMLYAGDGAEAWHVRVDLIAADDDGAKVGPVAEALRRDLQGTNTGHGWGAGVDQGIGVEGQPVIGLTFWVRADDLGRAALTALETARRAGAVANVGPDYYDVSLVPRSSVVGPEDHHTMEMPD